MLEQSPLNIVGCTREDCAGFAADAYARVHGMGALCVTYCVGGLSVCNSIAGAYAEKSPVVMITGSPGLRERIHNPLLHHMVRNFRTQYDVFEKLCVAGTELDDPLTRVQRNRPRAGRRASASSGRCTSRSRATWSTCGPRSRRRYKQPELPSDPRALDEAVEEAAERIENARQPVLLLGVEIHRFGLQDLALQARRGVGHPDGRHDARQGRRRRDASALHGPLRRRHRPRGGHPLRRGQRLRRSCSARS